MAASNTLYLDGPTWDLAVDDVGNIAAVSGGYALAQTAANALRTFLGEPWYATGEGVPYFESVLGQPASLPAVKAILQAAALTAQGVATAQVYLTSFAARSLTGIVAITDGTGAVTATTFATGG